MFHGHRTDIFQPYQSPNKQKNSESAFQHTRRWIYKNLLYLCIDFIRFHPFLRVRAYNTVINKVHKKTHCCLQTKTRLQNTNSYVTLLASLLLFLFYAFKRRLLFWNLTYYLSLKFPVRIKKLNLLSDYWITLCLGDRINV